MNGTRLHTQAYPEPSASNPGAKTSTVVSKDHARQGVTGHNVRYVLGSLAGVIFGFALVYLFFFAAR
jgi:hypothetical protein